MAFFRISWTPNKNEEFKLAWRWKNIVNYKDDNFQNIQDIDTLLTHLMVVTE